MPAPKRILTRVVCLGFGPLHHFLSPDPRGHRRCDKCEHKFRSLNIAKTCEAPMRVIISDKPHGE